MPETKSEYSTNFLLDMTDTSFYDQIPALVTILDTDGRILYYNKACIETTGYESHEVLGQTFYDKLIRKEESSRFKELYADFCKAREESRLKNYWVRKDGSTVFIDWSNKIFRDENGNVKYVVSTGLKIPERKKNELLKKAIYNINLESTKDIKIAEFCEFIHKELCEIIDASNLYISTFDQKKDELSFIYMLDESWDKNKLPPSRNSGNGLTEYIIKNGEGLFLNEHTIGNFHYKNNITIYGKRAKSWIGAPLKNKNQTVGVNAAQSYTNSRAYSSEDLNLLAYVGIQIGSLIEKKMAEEKLVESEAQKKAILKAVPDSMYITDLEGEYQVFKGVDELIDDIQNHSLFKVKMHDILPESIYKPELELSKKVIDTGIPEIFKYKFGDKHFESRIVKYGADKVLKIVRDITQEESARQELSQVNKKLQAFMENSAEITCVIDAKGMCSYVGPSLKRLMGYQQKELLNRNIFELMHPDDKILAINRFQKRLRDGKAPVFRTYRFIRKDGMTRYLRVIFKRESEDKSELNFLIHAQDITDLICNQSQLNQSMKDLKLIEK